MRLDASDRTQRDNNRMESPATHPHQLPHSKFTRNAAINRITTRESK